jgi:outer membrane lipoprotein-sorting protein
MITKTAFAGNLLDKALMSFDSLETYQVTIQTLCCESDEKITYTYKKPGFIRMDFINPHEGAVLVYNPETGKVRLKPSGIFSFIKLTLDPDNSLIKSPKGHTVDKSDMGELLKNIDLLRTAGMMKILGDEIINNRKSKIVFIKADTLTVDGINSYKIWLDHKIHLPLKTEAYDSSNKLIESVLTNDLQINIKLDHSIFDL